MDLANRRHRDRLVRQVEGLAEGIQVPENRLGERIVRGRGGVGEGKPVVADDEPLDAR